ncbi:hypothetical protein X975_18215, partial [Stegodyphus mimosarum]
VWSLNSRRAILDLHDGQGGPSNVEEQLFHKVSG